MARIKMVTRSIESTKCEVMCVNTDTAEVTYQFITLSGHVDDSKKTLEQIQKELAENEQAIVIRNREFNTDLYGMTETDFIKYSKILPPRTQTETEK